MMLLTHRHRAWQLAPHWLRRINLFRVLYVGALMLDFLADALMLAVKLRFLNYVTTIGLARTADERGLIRGPNETDDHFTARLQNWWDTGKRTGSFRTLAEQLAAFFSPTNVSIFIVSPGGHYVAVSSSDGSISRGQFGGWTWDTHDSEYTSRFWVLIPASAWGIAKWARKVRQTGAKVRQPGVSVGSVTARLNAASDALDSNEIRRIIEAFRPPHTKCDSVLIWYNLTPPAGGYESWVNRGTNRLYWRGE
jgi:hypothetical protein